MQTNVENLIEAARHLPVEDRHRLAHALLEESQKPLSRHHITEIRGLGSEVWKNVDAQDYVNSERDAWEN